MTPPRRLVYAERASIPLVFDLFLPEGGGPWPLVAFIHGGGWISGDPSHYWEEAEFMLAHGFAAASVGYRLAPLHTFPAAVDDVREFMRFIRAGGLELGIDATRVGVMGNSAGGHLAAMLGVAEADSRPDAVAAVCPITDLTDPHAQHFDIGWPFLEQFMGCPYDPEDPRWREASPLHHVRPGLPPFLVVHGEEDDVVPFGQGQALYERLVEAGNDARFVPMPGEMHGFSLEAWERVREEYLAFFRAKLGA